MTRLIDLSEQFHQSPWLDNLKRSYLTSGELAAFRDRGVRGHATAARRGAARSR